MMNLLGKFLNENYITNNLKIKYQQILTFFSHMNYSSIRLLSTKNEKISARVDDINDRKFNLP